MQVVPDDLHRAVASGPATEVAKALARHDRDVNAVAKDRGRLPGHLGARARAELRQNTGQRGSARCALAIDPARRFRDD
jgi:hypothetical protein